MSVAPKASAVASLQVANLAVSHSHTPSLPGAVQSQSSPHTPTTPVTPRSFASAPAGHGQPNMHKRRMSRVPSFVSRKFGDIDADVEFLKNVPPPVKKPGKLFTRPDLFHRPRLRQFWKLKEEGLVLVRENTEHKVSWNELFFDLIFVIIFNHLGTDLEHHLDQRGLQEFIVLYCAVWRVWSGANIYINRFHPQDHIHKLFYLAEMLAVSGFARHTTRGIVVSYVVARGVTEFSNLVAAYYEELCRRTVICEFVVFVVAAIPWLASLRLDSGADDNKYADRNHLGLWTLGMVLEGIGSVVVPFIPGSAIPANVEHLTERFGLLTIIMLGEQVVATLFSAKNATADTYLLALFGSIIVFCVHILYFDIEGGPQLRHALHANDQWKADAWYMLHLPLGCSITASAVSVVALRLTTEDGDTVHASDDTIQFERWLFSGSLAMSWLCYILMGQLHEELPTLKWPKKYRTAARILVIIILLGLPTATSNDQSVISVAVMVGVVAAVLALESVFELYGVVDEASVESMWKLNTHASTEDLHDFYMEDPNYTSSDNLHTPVRGTAAPNPGQMETVTPGFAPLLPNNRRSSGRRGSGRGTVPDAATLFAQQHRRSGSHSHSHSHGKDDKHKTHHDPKHPGLSPRRSELHVTGVDGTDRGDVLEPRASINSTHSNGSSMRGSVVSNSSDTSNGHSTRSPRHYHSELDEVVEQEEEEDVESDGDEKQ